MKNSVKTQEVFIEEVFNASIKRVFEAWTDPEKLMKWYAPDGCSIHFKKIEIRKKHKKFSLKKSLMQALKVFLKLGQTLKNL